MLEIKLEDGSLWKKIIDALKDVVDQGIFDCSSTGISLQSMDQSHVCLVHLVLKSEGFDEYRCDRNATLGIAMDGLSKILRCAGSHDSITLKAKDDTDVLSLLFESPNSEKVSDYQLKLSEINQESLGIPGIKYKSIIKLPSGEFSRICRDLSQIGDTVVISCTKEGVKFSCSGDEAVGNIKLVQSEKVDEDDDSAVIIDMKEGVVLSFALRYLNYFAKSANLSPRVTLSMAPDVPLEVEFQVKDMGHIRYYLAPKMEEDDGAGDD